MAAAPGSGRRSLTATQRSAEKRTAARAAAGGDEAVSERRRSSAEKRAYLLLAPTVIPTEARSLVARAMGTGR